MDGALEVGVRHLALLDKAMGHDGDVAAVKEVEEPIVRSSDPGAEFVDAVSQVVGVGPTKFVSQGFEHPHAGDASVDGALVPPGQIPKPLDDGAGAVGFAVDVHACLGHQSSPGYYDL